MRRRRSTQTKTSCARCDTAKCPQSHRVPYPQAVVRRYRGVQLRGGRVKGAKLPRAQFSHGRPDRQCNPFLVLTTGHLLLQTLRLPASDLTHPSKHTAVIYVVLRWISADAELVVVGWRSRGTTTPYLSPRKSPVFRYTKRLQELYGLRFFHSKVDSPFSSPSQPIFLFFCVYRARSTTQATPSPARHPGYACSGFTTHCRCCTLATFSSGGSSL